jgi:aspartyl protease family protein
MMFGQILKSIIGVVVIAAGTGLYLSGQLGPLADPALAQAKANAALAVNWFTGTAPSTGGASGQMAALAPQSSGGVSYGRVELRPDAGGQYHADVEIEGQRIPMLVDTGATLVSLTYADASRLGVAPAPADYKVDVHTANGVAKAARVSLREVRVGTLQVRDVQALVMPRDVRGTSLLGMSFLQRLGGFQIASGTLVLRP